MLAASICSATKHNHIFRADVGSEPWRVRRSPVQYSGRHYPPSPFRRENRPGASVGASSAHAGLSVGGLVLKIYSFTRLTKSVRVTKLLATNKSNSDNACLFCVCSGCCCTVCLCCPWLHSYLFFLQIITMSVIALCVCLCSFFETAAV